MTLRPLEERVINKAADYDRCGHREPVTDWSEPSLQREAEVKPVVSRGRPLRNLTYQSAEQITGLQDQLLVSHPHHTQRQQLLVGHLQQLVSVHLLPLEGGGVLLQAVVQT